MTFVDLTKAFDTVSRVGFRKIIAKFGCPPRFIGMARQTQARVKNDRNYFDSFSRTNEVEQGCVMTPALFFMTLRVVSLSDAALTASYSS